MTHRPLTSTNINRSPRPLHQRFLWVSSVPPAIDPRLGQSLEVEEGTIGQKREEEAEEGKETSQTVDTGETGDENTDAQREGRHHGLGKCCC